jgi:hypothetical protein
MDVVLYTPEQKASWDGFVASSKNGTFLMSRDYMEYHSERFQDYSLIVKNNKGKIVALLPANHREHVLYSHQGLTYGGIVSGFQMTTPLMLDVFKAVLQFLRKRHFAGIIYKTIPSVYHQIPAEEDRYALFVHRARLFRRDVLSVVDLEKNWTIQERRIRGVKKARKKGLFWRQSEDWGAFWEILALNLESKHGVKPVHSIEEIRLLKEKFPDNIKFFAVYRHNVMVGGAVIYETANAAHVQYTSCSAEGRTMGALDLLFNDLINDVYRGRMKYFDFGISTERKGAFLNVGLIEYKEGLGARALMHDFYELPIECGGDRH